MNRYRILANICEGDDLYRYRTFYVRADSAEDARKRLSGDWNVEKCAEDATGRGGEMKFTLRDGFPTIHSTQQEREKMSTRYNFDRLLSLGISYQDAVTLRRISMTLHRWHELECGDGNDYASWCVSRGSITGNVFEYGDDGRPYIERHVHNTTKPTYTLIADKEKGALRRLNAIMGKYPNLNAYVQGDPRGCALYVGEELTDSNYSSRGVAVYK